MQRLITLLTDTVSFLAVGSAFFIPLIENYASIQDHPAHTQQVVHSAASQQKSS